MATINRDDLIKVLTGRLIDYGFSVQQIKDQQSNELDTLRIAFTTPSGQPTVMDMTYMTIEDYATMQFYTYIAADVEKSAKEKIASAIEENNAFAPIGHFGYYQQELYYRYGYIFDKDATVETAADKIENLLEVLIVVLDNCLSLISERLDDK